MHVRCLLLVEDEPYELVRTQLKLAGTDLKVDEVLVATNLGQAIRAIVGGDVDIVLLDLDPSDPRAGDTLAAVRTVTDAVIIVLSSCENESQCVRVLNGGADDFLIKSQITVESLREVIVRGMTRRQIRRSRVRISAGINKLAVAAEAR